MCTSDRWLAAVGPLNFGRLFSYTVSLDGDNFFDLDMKMIHNLVADTCHKSSSSVFGVRGRTRAHKVTEYKLSDRWLF